MYEYLYLCTVNSVVYLISTPKMHIYSFKDLKFTLKHLKLSYMFRSYDHPPGAYIVLAKFIV